MHWQNFKIAFRNLKNQGKYTVLNISGLTLGLLLTIMMVMLLHYELSFNGFHQNKDKIYKICSQDLKSGELHSYTPFPLPMTLKNDFPEIKHAVGIWKMLHKSHEVTYKELPYSGFTGASVEPDIFSIFDFSLILGEKENVLDAANKIVISNSLSKKIFGSENPVGKTLSLQNYKFVISGVFKDLPENTELNFDVLFSDRIREEIISNYKNAWWHGGIHTYVILHNETSIKQFGNHLKKIPERYFPDFLKGRSTFFAEPFKSIHFNNSIKGGLVPAVSPMYLIILSSIALITLMIACINFINLTTCQATKRNKNTGIRKIAGAGKRQIVLMHLWYSLLSAITAALLAIPLSYLLLPYFENLIRRPVSDHLLHPVAFGVIILIVLLVALLTGLIPGIFYSKISAIKALQFRINKGAIGGRIRNSFIIAQFTITILLIIAQFFILKQISFMRHADLGFNNDNLVAIHINHIDEDKYSRKYELAERYKRELEKYGAQFGFGKGVITENIPGFYYQNSFTVNPVDGKIQECLVTSTAIDENFLEVYEIPLIEGRFFSREIQSDREAIIINETLMKKIGWKSIEGKYLRFQHDRKEMPVVGVIEDIHTTTLKERIGPMVYRFGQHNNSPGFLTFRIYPDNSKEAISFMHESWEKMFPDAPFMHFFVKEKYFQNYAEEERLSKIVGSFALLAIILSSLGLLGLIGFFTDQRIKEIGIRKVNGARIREILAMLNAVFLKWVIFAFIIACPIAWYAMTKWLQNFAYKTEISWWIFALAGVIALGIALLTVSWQSWRAARRNPVEALRYE